MSVIKIKAGQTVPLEQSFQGIHYLVNFGSPHVHITKTPDGNDYFLQGDTLAPNASKILFDSYWFNYLRIDQAIPFSITLGSRIGTYVDGGKKGYSYWAPVSGTTQTYIGNHGRADVPAFFAISGGNVLSTAILGYGASLRTLTLVSNSNAIYLKEGYIALGTTIPSVTISGVVYILKSSLTSAGGEYTPSNYGMYVTPSRTILGQGKFDSDYNYLYADPAGFKVYRTAALRAQYGFRLGYSPYNGQPYLNYSSFNNSFSVMQDGGAIYSVNNIKVAHTLTDTVPLQNVSGTTMGFSVP